MAKVIAYTGPESDYDYTEGENVTSLLDRHDKNLAKLEAAHDEAVRKGSYIGLLHRVGVADGCAMYRVVSAKPLILEHIPYMDAYHASAAEIRGTRLQDILPLNHPKRK